MDNITANELIMNGKDKVRRDSNLMHLYLELFQEAFNQKPNCISCSFSKDWNRFVSFYSNNKNTTVIKRPVILENIKIKKISGKILSYKKDGKTYRLYDNILTAEFINGYLSHGTETEIEERKKLFKFPETPIVTPVEKPKRKRVGK